jgi:hypothetical protein
MFESIFPSLQIAAAVSSQEDSIAKIVGNFKFWILDFGLRIGD